MGNEKQNFLKHFLIIGSGTIINMIIGLITTPVITRIVNPDEYGQYSIFTMYSSIALMVLCLGYDQALVRFFYENNSDRYRNAILYKCVRLPLIISIVASVFTVLISALGIVRFEFSISIIIWLCIYTIIQILYRFGQLVLRLQYKSKMYSSMSILYKFGFLVLSLVLIMLFNRNYLLCLVIATVIPTFASFAGCVLSERKTWFPILFNSDSCDNVSNTELLKYSAPFIVSMGVTTLFQAIDKISLNYYCTYSEVGIYSSTMTLVHIFAIIQSTFNALWSPMAVENYTKNPNDRTLYQKGNSAITVIMFFIGICLILFKDIFAVLLGEKYREAAYILPFLIFNPIMYTISETTCGGLVFKKKSNMQVIVAVGACITNIIGNILLVPRCGCKGAAISTGISYIVFFTLRTFFSNKYYFTDFSLKKFYTLTILVSCYAMYNTFFKFNVLSIVGWLICLTCIILFYFDTIKWGSNYLNKLLHKRRI